MLCGVTRLLFLALVLLVRPLCGQTNPPATPPNRAFAATVNPYATDAALEAIRAGGNAVDGAVAAAVTLGIVDSHNSGIGGGLFMLIRKPDGTFVAIDGREMAPSAATREMFLKDGKADVRLSQEGPLASGVPGWLAALDRASKDFGKRPLSEALTRAATLADEGFVPDPGFEARRNRNREAIERHPATAAILLQPFSEGKLRMRDLAATYRFIAESGAGWFYNGPFAAEVESWMGTNGGIMTSRDFARYRVKLREPLRTTYRGYEIVGFPPPSSGGVHVAQILKILEEFDLKAMGDGSADFIHVVAEAMKLAFADRAHWLGDPDFANVPRGLVEKAYGKQLAAKIDLKRATPVPSHGAPPDTGLFEKHTTHFSVADAEGWWVGCTATINTTWGSLVTIPGTGVVLNNEMDDFSIEPGVPNAFGLVGAEANAVQAQKRPLSSMSPTIVLRDGKPVLVVGAAGGPTIITQVLLAIIRTVDFGLPPKEAIGAPRFHQQWKPDVLRIERAVPESIRAELQRRGHQLNVVGEMGVSQAVGTDGMGFRGAHDPRVAGKAGGF
jgi:gamma-glutamyltranspeptidase / glutathione hydrolase